MSYNIHGFTLIINRTFILNTSDNLSYKRRGFSHTQPRCYGVEPFFFLVTKESKENDN